ncbi:MAG: stage III sporulation protein AF [Negativicutes bacterium]|nr:stage III sporulation protein AF [Negativicutes bacterium]
MVAIITGWIKNIILIVLFASFMELLLPNSSLQRFVRVIMGLLIMLAILNPVIDVVQGNWLDGEVPTLSASMPKQAEIVRTAQEAASDRERIARDIYKRDLSKQIRALVMAIDGVADSRVSIELSSRAGAVLEKITVYVKPGQSSNIGSVEIVKIGKNAEHPELELKDTVVQKIKITITELYQLRNDQIDIKTWN